MTWKSALRLNIGLLMGIVGIIILVSLLPMNAGYAQGFATNTPSGAATQAPVTIPLIGASPTSDTNAPTVTLDASILSTPVPAVINTPDAPIEFYALRQWLEQDVIDVLLTQIAVLSTNDTDENRLAVRLLAHELVARTPGAPTSLVQRERLLQALVTAPRGSVDMRWLLHPYLAQALNDVKPETTFELSGFRVDITPARLNPDGVPDAVLHILYPEDATDPADVLYEEYLLATRTEDGSFNMLPLQYELPPAPFGDIISVSLQRLNDVNRDGLDEMVVLVNDSQPNDRLFIIGNRNEQAVDLALPGSEIRVGSIVSWDVTTDSPDIPVLSLLNFRVESAAPDWVCLSEIPVEWRYENNYYRDRVSVLAQYTPQDTLGCTLHTAEPLFAKTPREITTLIETSLVNYSLQAVGADRALMTLAMLYVIEGRLTEAQGASQAAALDAEPDSWVVAQSEALLTALGVSSNTALDICEALVLASPEPACDIDALLGRYLGLSTFTTETDLIEQLEAAGFPVAESVTIAEVGKANRTAVSFNFTGSGWWGFAAQRDGTYVVEKANPPTGFDAAILPQGLLQIPDGALEALIVNNDPQTALAIIESLEQNNPGLPLAASAFYVKALSYDLAAQRPEARQAYFDLWTRTPRNVWGQLAAQHLERRS